MDKTINQIATQEYQKVNSSPEIEELLFQNPQELFLKELCDFNLIKSCSDALPLFIIILESCVENQQNLCNIKLGGISEKLDVSNVTISNWSKKLQRLNLVSSVRHSRYMTFFLNERYSSFINLLNNCKKITPLPENNLIIFINVLSQLAENIKILELKINSMVAQRKVA